MSHQSRRNHLEVLESFDRAGRAAERADRDATLAPTAPRHAFTGAELVTDYWALECRLRAPIRWRIRRKSPGRIAALRARLTVLRDAFGLCYHGPDRIVT